MEFQTRVIVELEVCSEQSIRDDEQALAEAFVRSYNQLALQYCDLQFFRSLEKATVVEQGPHTADGLLPVVFNLEGICRGCDPDDTSIYDLPSGNTGRRLSDRRHVTGVPTRHLQEATETCYCSPDPIANRAPSEAEVLDAFRIEVSSLQDLACAESVAQCDFGTEFETIILLSLGNSSGVEAFEAQLGGSTLDVLTDLYRTTDTVCFEETPVFLSAEVRFGVDPTTRRALRGDGSQWRVLQSSNQTNTTPALEAPSSEAPSSAPTFSFEEGASNVLLVASGFCNGCTNDFLLSNQVSRMLRSDVNTERPSDRFLQSLSPSSNCFCLPGASVQESKPSIDAFREQLQERLPELAIEGVQELDPSVCAEGACDEPPESTDLSALISPFVAD